MEIPSHVVIDGLLWEVDQTASLGSALQGECDGDECLIKIAGRLTEQLRRQVFWHELLHAFLASREFEADIIINLPAERVEETIVRMIAPALFSFLERNCRIEWKAAE